MEVTGQPDLDAIQTTGVSAVGDRRGLSGAARTGAPVPPAPAVVAVVVTRNPGPALDDTLASLVVQDHPVLSVLVIDDGSTEPVHDRVGSVAPGAYVRRFDHPIGYGAAANAVTEMVQGAAYFLFCHDDVALAPDSVRLLVAAASAADAVIAGPKVVSWDDHERFLSLGYAVDRAGSPVSLVELDELDQGQHDQVREVTAVHGATMLVACSTFTSVGGFMPSLTAPADAVNANSGVAAGPDLGEDIDLCLRVRRSGGRLVIIPAARVAHVSAVHGTADAIVGPAPARRRPHRLEPAPIAEQRLLRDRNRIRSIVALSGATRLVVLLPMLVIQALRHGSPPSAALPGRRRTPFTTMRLALANRSVRTSARTLANRSGDADLGDDLVPVSGRLRADIRSDVTADSARVWRLIERALGSRRGGRLAIGAFALLAVVLAFGSRGLVTGGIGRSGRLVPLPPVRDLWRTALAGWHEPALGRFGLADPGQLMLAIAGSLLLGTTGFLATFVALAPFGVGALGIWRSVQSRPGLGSSNRVIEANRSGVAIAAAITYLLVPIPFDAITTGNRAALWGYALMPWLFRSLERFLGQRLTGATAATGQGAAANAVGIESSVDVSAAALSPSRRRFWQPDRPTLPDVLRSAMLVAIAIAFGPANAFVWVQTIVLVAIGAFVTHGAKPARAVLLRGALVLVAAAALLFPWVVDLVGSRFAGWSFTGDDAGRMTVLRIDQLLRLQTTTAGSIGTTVLAGAFVIAAVFALLVADGARLLLAIRCWVLIGGSVLIAWLAGRGWLPSFVPGPSLVLLPAAYGMSRAAAEGLGALIGEVRRRGFGWRQGFAGLALASVAISSVPVFRSSIDGRWGRPTRATVEKLSWMRGLTDGGFRVAFLGDPEVLPASAMRVGPNLGVAISRDGLPTIDDQWTVEETTRLRSFTNALGRARIGATTRLGAELAPLGIRYVVVVERTGNGTPRRRTPVDLRQALLDQLDLRAIDSSTDLTAYENDAWVPLVWSPLTAAAGLEAGGSVNTAGASNALDPAKAVTSPAGSESSSDGADGADAALLTALRYRPPSSSFTGTVESDAVLVAAVPPDDHWLLRVRGRGYRPIRVNGYIDASGTTREVASSAGFATDDRSGPATLTPERPWFVSTSLLGVGLLWLLAIIVVARRRHFLRLAAPEEADGLGDAATDEDDAFDDAFVDDEFADPFPSTVRRAVGVAPEETPVDGSVADELWTRFARRRLQGGDDSDAADNDLDEELGSNAQRAGREARSRSGRTERERRSDRERRSRRKDDGGSS